MCFLIVRLTLCLTVHPPENLTVNLTVHLTVHLTVNMTVHLTVQLTLQLTVPSDVQLTLELTWPNESGQKALKINKFTQICDTVSQKLSETFLTKVL